MRSPVCCLLVWLVVEQQLPGRVALVEMVQLVQDGGVLEDELQDGEFDEAIELKQIISNETRLKTSWSKLSL